MRTTVGSHPAEVGAARRAVGRALEAFGMMGDKADVVVLLTSELVTNAIRYGGAPVELRARTLARGAVRVEVADVRPGHVVPRDNDVWAVSGRGLQMVDSLADRWGCNSGLDGKTVWFEVGLADVPDVGRSTPERPTTPA